MLNSPGVPQNPLQSRFSQVYIFHPRVHFLPTRFTCINHTKALQHMSSTSMNKRGYFEPTIRKVHVVLTDLKTIRFSEYAYIKYIFDYELYPLTTKIEINENLGLGKNHCAKMHHIGDQISAQQSSLKKLKNPTFLHTNSISEKPPIPKTKRRYADKKKFSTPQVVACKYSLGTI